MSLSSMHLHLFLLKINLYEPGIVKIIQNIVEDLIKFYHELTMTQIKDFLKLKEKVFDHRFSITAVRNLESVKVNEMIKYIDSPRDCIFFKHSEHYLLDISSKLKIAHYIFTYMFLNQINENFTKLINFYDFIRLTNDKVKNMISLITNGINQPYVKWYLAENCSDDIDIILKLKRAGFSDLWCGEPLKNHFSTVQINKMIDLRKNRINNDLSDERLYWMVKNRHY